MKRRNREAIKATLFEAIENQLEANDPPETKETLDRLRVEGHTHEEAMKLIACVLLIEINDILKTQRPYDNIRYTTNLKRLPELPEDEGD